MDPSEVVKGGAESDVYVIAGEKRYMVPAVREFVREIRVDEGYVRLHLIEGMAIDEN